ncbi:MAG: hypothetical protein Q9191_003575, partial [Dirinaria sp. TL-2023a]
NLSEASLTGRKKRQTTTLYGIPQSRPVWCAVNTSTYIRITPGGSPSLNATEVNTTLANSIRYISRVIEAYGDSTALSDGAQFLYAGYNDVILAVDQTAKWSLTWKIMQDAVAELLDWMIEAGGLGAAQFDLYNGQHAVGTGAVKFRQIEV